jgi:hypothetical protein
LSVVHKIFDLLGFSCPVTLFPKLMIQNSWNLKSDWNTVWPEEIQRGFKAWVAEFPLLSEV